MELWEYLQVLNKNKWLILLMVGVAALSAWLASDLATPIYEAQTTVLIKKDQSTQLSLMPALPGQDKDQENYVEILKSRSVLEKVRPGGIVPPTAINIQPVQGTDLIRIRVEDKDPRAACALANGLVQAFIERTQEMARQQAGSARRFIEEQLEIVRRDLADAEERLKRYKEANKIYAPDVETQAQLERLSNLEAARAEAVLARQEAEARLRELGRELGSQERTIISSKTFSANPLINQYQAKLGELEIALAGAREKYTDQHPSVKEIQAEIAATREKLRAQVQTVVSGYTEGANPLHQGITQEMLDLRATSLAAGAKAAALAKMIAAQEADFATLPQRELGLVRLSRNVKVTEEIYLMLSQRYEEIRITEAMKTGDVHVVDRAEVPPNPQPIKPRTKLNIAVAVVLALFVGVGLAFLFEYLDMTIKTPEQIEKGLGLPVLGVIPTIHPRRRKRKRKPSSFN